MDEIVKQAMAKWPNVPHCYGWLRLDARGAWRMRDEQAQALNLAGDRIDNPALLDFIHRNYAQDACGQWYFQNGPQRVYVDLEATPFIARTDQANGLVLHTGEAFATFDSVWMTECGQLVIAGKETVAQLDDRDLHECLDAMRIADALPSDVTFFSWLCGERDAGDLTWRYRGKRYEVTRIPHEQLPLRFHFIRQPRVGRPG